MYALHIVTWNGRKYMEAVFASLKSQSLLPGVVRVLENGSIEGTREWVEAEVKNYFPEARVTVLAENTGFAGGHNLLWQQLVDENLREEYVMLVNQDLWLDVRYVQEVIAYMDKHPNVASAAGVLFHWSTAPFQPDFNTLIVDSCGIEVFKTGKAVEVCAGSREIPVEDQKVFGVSGTLPMYRVSAIQKAPHPSGALFDPHFQSYKEDVELAYRLQALKFESACVANARAWHDRSVGAFVARDVRSYVNRYTSYRNHLLTLYLHDAFTARVIVYELGKFCYLAVKEPKILKGFVDFWRLLPKMKIIRGEYRKRIFS